MRLTQVTSEDIRNVVRTGNVAGLTRNVVLEGNVILSKVYMGIDEKGHKLYRPVVEVWGHTFYIPVNIWKELLADFHIKEDDNCYPLVCAVFNALHPTIGAVRL